MFPKYLHIVLLVLLKNEYIYFIFIFGDESQLIWYVRKVNFKKMKKMVFLKNGQGRGWFYHITSQML